MESHSTAKLSAFLETLEARHAAIAGEENEDPSLIYANAVLRYREVIREHPELIPQIVIIGPTQAGKSTAVNTLLGTVAAEANMLAGFTRHAQGFCTEPVNDELSETIDRLLPGLTRVELSELRDDQLHTYAITQVENANPVASPSITWDTPDFDSVSSRSYRFGVPKLCALADLIVLVVSKEKYADQSVWETLRLINEMPHPLLICINKAGSDNAPQLEAAMATKLAQEKIEYGSIVSLPYLPDPELQSMLDDPAGQKMRQLARQLLPEDRPLPDDARLKQFLHQHWMDWTAPLRREIRASRTWHSMLDAEIRQAEAAYQRNYLRDPHYSDTLQRAIVKLMELLELPGIGSGIGKMRDAISWPARTLFSKVMNRGAERSPKHEAKPDIEATILMEILDELLISLQRQAGEHAADDDTLRNWWQQLWIQLQQESRPPKHFLETCIRNHQQAFEPYIQAAAEDLYQYLQKNPALLNSLRAARVTTDVGALVLALKTGGIGLNDLVLAPAMLAFTSMLTEGAVGRYMHKVEAELKAAQLESVRKHVFIPVRQRLESLPSKLDPSIVYGFTEAELLAAEQELNAL